MTTGDVNKFGSPSVQVRFAELDDVHLITNVINSAFRQAEGFFIDEDRIDVATVLNLLSTGKFLLAESDTLLGCVYVEPRPVDDARRPDHAYLGLLAVDPKRQQRGLGSLLMEAAETYCRDLACRFMDIKVVNLREELSGFYRKRGYVENGTSPFPPDISTKRPCHFIEMSKPLFPPSGNED